MYTSSLYVRSPVWLQNIILSVRALARQRLREGQRSCMLGSKLIENEKSVDSLANFSSDKLSEVLRSAVSSVPFYKSLDAVDISALNSFPIISKKDIRSKPMAFQSAKVPRVIVKGATSGTTGSPLSIPQSMESVVREQAFITRSLNWADFKKGDRRAWLRGDMIVPQGQKSGPFWRYSYFEDMILLSSFHMTTAALPGYIQAMLDYKVDVIQAYPSSIVTLAKYLASCDEYYPGKIKSVLTSSESLSAEDRQLVEERFRCKVFDWYGLFERVAAIASCEHGNYHVLTDYAHVEFLDVGDGRHEIVGTNFNNNYYPLIRYKTGDHVILSKETECPCGRVYPMVERIEGRVGDYLIGEDGQKVHILNHISKGIVGLLGCQFVQDKPRELDVLAVVDRAVFDALQEKQLIQNVKERLGQSMTVAVRCVDALPRTKNGKVRQAVCTIEVVS